MAAEPRLQLVGGQQVIAADDSARLFDFYGSLFARLPAEVPHTGSLTRTLVYQCQINSSDTLHFIGIEVETITDLPPGLIAWDLSGDHWTVWEAGQTAPAPPHQVTWLWSAPPNENKGRWIGEFARRDTPPFRLTGQAYGEPSKWDRRVDDVRLVEYDPTWPQQFADFARWLQSALGTQIARRIEHYGSTAIPGLPAKPIIDILIEIPSFDEVKPQVIALFNQPTWDYWWYADHMTFVRRDRVGGVRTHHLHLAPRDHPLWQGLAFRDYLRDHPDDAAQYAALKHELAARFGADRERYTQAKTDFVQQIVAKTQPKEN